MKFIFLLLFFPLFSYSQKLKVNEIDKFTKQKRVETERTWLKRASDGVSVSFRSVDDSYYLKLYGYGRGTGIVDEEDKLIFLLDDESSIIIYPTGLQDYSINTGTSTYNHQYHISLEQIQTFSEHNIKSIRKYTSKGYADFDIPNKKQDEVKKLAILLLKNI
jgi:hypothetical protein